MKSSNYQSLFAIIAASILLSGCVLLPPVHAYREIGTGFNGISSSQASAECEWQADQAMNEALTRTRGGIFSGAYAKANAMSGCMRSKGF